MSHHDSALRSTTSGHGPREALDKQHDVSPDASPYASSEGSRTSSLTSIAPVDGAGQQGITDYIPLSRAGQGPKWLRPAAQRKSQLEEALRNSRLSPWTRWLSGPSPPRKYTIKSLFPSLQTWPQKVLSKWLPGTFAVLSTVAILLAWLVTFSIVLTVSVHQGSSLQPVRLACETTLWPNTTFCGLDGINCQPFEGATFAFRCPSNCDSTQVLEPHTIGKQEIIYRTMAIGGPASDDENSAVYRGDSFICASAIHAGVIENNQGGCGILHKTGKYRRFAASSRHGISSIDFPASFPLSYSLASTNADCSDPQWRLLGLSLCATTLLSLLTASSSIFFGSTFTIVFFQVALASDPPFSADFASVLSMAFERYLPTAFVAWLLYSYCIRYTLHGLEAHLEKTVLWLGGCWIGALNNYTFDKIPISRLTEHDLTQQPGAITALIVILLVILAAGIGQAWCFRVEGRLLRYLGFYLVLGIIVASLAAVPGLQLRLHHYIIALLLLPGTSLQTRPSLLYQGILVGLFIDGVARWGYASILQTADALREDGQLGSLLPEIVAPVITSQIATFFMPTVATGFDGISVLVNDVERYRAHGPTLVDTFNWTRTEPEDPMFFRFAFTGTKPLGGTWYGDYTKPGTWYANGTWEEPGPDPSK